MGSSYRILDVQRQHDVTIATCSMSTIAGADVWKVLIEDYDQLLLETSPSIILDYRQVTGIDGSFFKQLLELDYNLKLRQRRLSIRVHPSAEAVVRIAKLDRLLDYGPPRPNRILTLTNFSSRVRSISVDYVRAEDDGRERANPRLPPQV